MVTGSCWCQIGGACLPCGWATSRHREASVSSSATASPMTDLPSSAKEAAALSPAWPRLSWQRLEADPEERLVLCKTLASLGFAVIVVPQVLRQALAEVATKASEFFDQPADVRNAVGGLRIFRLNQPGAATGKVIGYREIPGSPARFLEVHAVAGGGVVPEPAAPVGLGPVAERVHSELLNMGRTLVAWLAEHLNAPPSALLHCLDEPGFANLEKGDVSASVLRLACYDQVDAASADCIADVADEPKVVFDEHTDASFVTIAPLGTAPGLQMQHPETGEWLDIEKGLPTEEGHIIVFVGDFVEKLTKGAFAAAVHRVVLPSSLQEPVSTSRMSKRLSMPFLLRGQPDAILNTAQFLPPCPEGVDSDTEDDSCPLLRVRGMEYRTMRKFLDMKGRWKFNGQRLLSAGRQNACAK
eukprot:gnl/TRDRNA2_/TRDRNA2_136485_c0_seq1.p1 gnl/TRDRNA2_/TRDRNA2_136485_c0~~gnl/TRDRNA2_/TRDRNA2_136485_c0_seq1.p1  ORF type:complete len:414 (+),score=78.31 gnl/TRDRNA2_/TRDRNA2_136485_c0_seq1:49-1290(+)